MPRSIPSRKIGGPRTQTRSKCSRCHNLDPREHANTLYPKDNSANKNYAVLNLVIDALGLSKAATPPYTGSGCRFCKVLAQALDAFSKVWRDFRGRILVEIKEKGTIKVVLDKEEWKHESIEIYAISEARSPWPMLGAARRIPIDSGSDETFDFARRCIQDCLTNPKHEACRRTSTSTVLGPKRLIDVGRVGRPIRLIDTHEKKAQYAALSHCWGKGPTLTATKSNWQKLSSNIPFDALPSLFQDAIIITRQLGLRYLWIDSLCIIQDSVRDWETESTKMGSIYENGHITISATSSGDGSAHCLQERRKPVKISYENTKGKEHIMGARLVLEHHPNLEECEPAKPFGPLTKRAWTLQEHVLSTRVLHYTPTELLFECKTSYRCECLPARKNYPTTPALIPKALSSLKTNKKHDGIWDVWQRILETYSHRNLTVASDKLPAISGIAKTIQKATGSSYLGGLWADHLASDLLWNSMLPRTGEGTSYALESYRAPTFSWASVDAPITYYAPDDDERLHFKSLLKIITTTISPAGLNPLGTVSAGSIRILGPCITATLASEHGAEGNCTYTLLIKGTSAMQMLPDSFLVEREICTAAGETQKTVRRARSGDELVNFKTPVLCLGVGLYDHWIGGLVLGISSRDPEAWERLGTFSAGTEVFASAEKQELTMV
ncbi:HET-domain-containing protein [Aaosphaeria arxii CBS 175.79]|uniref:HET-domain-containing protein n=1 Tax=Aaosphaeria arxii CBS 175.79 TaxID=1450172 RepID=A0A6A5XY49_9PLEO|nr:HET-domain-containing protein [Aaosphaeria arxii CBS 175.79]KAF2018255.1 HET-domain-containing protein [Aaosphaeria arxii CBS 175.79]